MLTSKETHAGRTANGHGSVEMRIVDPVSCDVLRHARRDVTVGSSKVLVVGNDVHKMGLLGQPGRQKTSCAQKQPSLADDSRQENNKKLRM